MSKSKDMLLGRLDKTLSRESLAIVGTLYSLIESSAPPEIMAVFGSVAMVALSGEKAARSLVTVYAQTRAVATQAAAVIDSQTTPTDGPGFASKAGAILLALGAGLGIGSTGAVQGCTEKSPPAAEAKAATSPADSVDASTAVTPDSVTMAADVTKH
jgi:xanthosine utilization system XapX-like protein